MEQAYTTAERKFRLAFGEKGLLSPNEHDMSCEERRLVYEYTLIADLSTQALGQHMYGNPQGARLCQACLHLPAKLEEFLRQEATNRQALESKSIVHLEDARIILTTRHTCRVCALFLFSATTQDIRAQYLERSLLAEPLRLSLTDDDRAMSKSQSRMAAFVLKMPCKAPGIVQSFLGLDSYRVSIEASSPILMQVVAKQPSSTELTKFIHGRLPLENAQSDQMYEWLSASLEQCTQHHGPCNSKPITSECTTGDEESALPTRVLHITSQHGRPDFALRLMESSGMRAKYAALSHCWGNKEHHPPMTTKGNLRRHQEAIDMSELPPTFQDAVKFIARLGICYLWIDSLCIIQDDEHDWDLEAVRMSAVYGNAHITLAASHARHSGQGLFFPRPIVQHAPTASIPLKSDDLANGELRLITEHYGTVSGGKPVFSAMSLRAWCFQEEILSRRIIWFTYAQLIWDCRQGAVAETGLHVSTARHRNSLSQSDVLQDWQYVIERYSARLITYAKDRPIAIKGLADQAEKYNSGSAYHAGIWLSRQSAKTRTANLKSSTSFPYELLWTRVSDYVREITSASDLDKLLLPSWSWLSINAPVFYMRPRPQDILRCISHADFICNNPGVLLAEGHFFPTDLYDVDVMLPRHHADNQTLPEGMFLSPARGPHMSLQSLTATELDSNNLLTDLKATIAKMCILGLLKGHDLQLVPDAYISWGARDKHQICGWIILDRPLDTRLDDADAYRPYWILPVLTWKLCEEHLGSFDPDTPFHEVLVLQAQPGLSRQDAQHGNFRRVGVGKLTAFIGNAIIEAANKTYVPVQVKIV